MRCFDGRPSIPSQGRASGPRPIGRSLTAIVLLVAVSAAGCTSDPGPDPSQRDARSSSASVPSPRDATSLSSPTAGCEAVPFGPTSGEPLEPGSGGQVGIPVDEQFPRALGHWGTQPFVDVYLAEDFPPVDRVRRRIRILDGAAFAGVGTVEDGFTARFSLEGCGYVLAAYGYGRRAALSFFKGLTFQFMMHGSS